MQTAGACCLENVFGDAQKPQREQVSRGLLDFWLWEGGKPAFDSQEEPSDTR